jgi:hypothetical protein
MYVTRSYFPQRGAVYRWEQSLGIVPYKVKVKATLRLTASQSVSLGVEPHLGLVTRYLLQFDSYGLVFVVRPSDESTGLSFVFAASPCQRSPSRVRAPLDSRPYFTISDMRLPFSSPPMTCRVTVEVFDPASTRVSPVITRHGFPVI